MCVCECEAVDDIKNPVLINRTECARCIGEAEAIARFKNWRIRKSSHTFHFTANIPYITYVGCPVSFVQENDPLFISHFCSDNISNVCGTVGLQLSRAKCSKRNCARWWTKIIHFNTKHLGHQWNAPRVHEVPVNLAQKLWRLNGSYRSSFRGV